MEQRPWTKFYPAGVPANINPEEYQTLRDYLLIKCKEHANRKAFSCMGKELTFKEIDKMSDQFGAYLQSRGVEPGDRVALMMPNLLQYPIALFGCIKAGIIIVNTNPLYTPREMEHQFTDSQVKAIVIAENFAGNLEKVIGKTDIKTVITTSIGELLGGMKGWVTDLAVKRIKKMVPKYNIPNTVKFKDALKQGKKFELNTDFANEPDTVIVHQYTGGTTGVSKGAMLTNKNLVSNMLQLSAIFKPYMTKDVERIVLCPLPLYHIYAFSCNCLAMMDTGSLSVLITNPRDLSTIIKEFNRYKVTGMTGVNTLYNGLNNHPDLKNVDLSHMEFASAGGTALQNAVAQEWEKNTGTIISEGFGMTETSPVASSNPKGGVRIGTIGIPVPSTDMRIVDDGGKPIATGEIGEIQVKGPQVMKGYYKRPDETAKTITSEGWLNTGDIGQMDEDGYFKIVDRKKDMINVSGFNVYPNEIEDVVAMHKKVDEVACIGVEDDKSGEVVKVFIVKKDKSLNEKEIIEHCREYLTGYKIPKQIAFMDDLPKSTVGKILRRELRGK
tara:strand:+ start:349 stop:2013 length:1665 start_codon:yes stop_codon:yes gene_type:complete